MEIADALQGKARLMPSSALYSAQIQIASGAVQEGQSEEESEDSCAHYLPDPQPYTHQVPAQVPLGRCMCTPHPFSIISPSVDKIFNQLIVHEGPIEECHNFGSMCMFLLNFIFLPLPTFCFYPFLFSQRCFWLGTVFGICTHPV